MAASMTPDTLFHGKGPLVADSLFIRFGTLNLGTYATGGVAVDKSLFGFPVELVHVDLTQAGGRVYEYNKTTGKIIAYRNAAGAGDLAEVANATDLSATNVRFMAYGK